MKFIAYVTKGLEDISEQELSEITGVTIISNVQKFIRFEYAGDPTIFQTLKTVDDIGVVIGELESSETAESLINILEPNSVNIAIDSVRRCRPLDNTFSVTLSLYKSILPKEALEEFLVTQIKNRFGLEFTPLEHTNIDFRINIEQSHVLMSIKFFPDSLYKRAYGHQTQLGSLRSTIAAAMLYKLTTGREHLQLVDNFCGSGTFLCEAFARGYAVSGGDKDPQAVEITKRNLTLLGIEKPQVFVQDARQTNWPAGTFDIAVANLPWDKQIEVSNLSELFEGAIKEYARILKPEAQLGIISTKPELVLKYVKKYFHVKTVETYKIGYIGQTPTIQSFEVGSLKQ